MYSSEQNTLIMKMNAASYPSTCNMHGDHSPDNVKFPDISVTVCSTALLCELGMLSVTHIMSVLVLLSSVGVGMQQCMI